MIAVPPTMEGEIYIIVAVV